MTAGSLAGQGSVDPATVKNPLAAQPQAPIDLPEVVVRLASPGTDRLFSAIKSVPVKISYPGGWVVYNAGTVENARRLAEEWQNDPLLTHAAVNQRTFDVKSAFVPNDPYFTFNSPAGQWGQWHLINTSNAGGAGIDVRVQTPWNNDWTGSGVVVGIVDDSVEVGHPDLTANHVAANSFDFGQNDTDPSPVHSNDNHGTAVAGVAVGRGGNALGTTGAAPFASLGGLRIDFPAQTTAMFAAANEFRSTVAQGSHIKVKNHSYGPSGNYGVSTTRNAALDLSTAAGTIHVFAAGNNRDPDPSFSIGQDSAKKAEQNNPSAITIAALAPIGTFSDYSCFGGNVFAAAPSSGVVSAAGSIGITTTDRSGANGYNGHPDNNYTNGFGGTSSASPLAAGVLALVKHRQPLLNTRFAKHLIARFSDVVDAADATDTSDGGWKTNGAGLKFNQNYGFGLINATKLVQNAPLYTGVSALATTTTGTTSVATAIPDATVDNTAGTFVSRTFVIASTTPLEEVLVNLNVSHTFRGDLQAFLTSPSGTRSRLMHRQSADGPDNINWTFTNNAFWGENPAGTWTLEIADYFTTDTGTWNSYNVTLRQGTLLQNNHTLAIAPTSVIGGATATGTVTLTSPAPAGGTVATLTYSGASVSGPASVTVPAGSTTAAFTINTTTVSTDTLRTVTATVAGNPATANLTVLKAAISSLTVSPSTPVGGVSATGTVTLNRAVTTNTTVNLSYTPSGSFSSTTASVVVNSGSDTANFTFTPSVVLPSGFSGSITGTLNATTATANFNVLPNLVQGTFVYPMNAVLGQRVFVVTRLTGNAGSNLPVTVTTNNTSILANSNPTVLSGTNQVVTPMTLGNPANLAAFANITVTTNANSETRTDTFQVRPPTNALASGFNSNFQVGDGTNRFRELFSVINTTNDIVQAVASANCLVVLKSDGTVWTVGQGTFGQHGDGTSGAGAVKTTLSQVPGLTNIKLISANAPTILALDGAGEVWAWGQNNVGQCAVTPLTNVLVPTKIVGLSNIVTVAAGAFAGFALDGNGAVWSWGSSSLGANGRTTNNTVPATLPIGQVAVDIAAGNQHGFAIRADGTLVGWGKNTNGELGDGTFTNRTAPTVIPGVTDVRMVQGGLDHSILLRIPPYGGTRQVMTTGSNSHGQRGDGSAVGGAATNVWNAIASATNITQVATGNRHSFYIGAGTVRSWGFGSNGERADGSIVTSRNTPGVLPDTVSSSNVLASAANSVSMTAVRNAGRGEALMINTGSRTFRTTNFRTGVETALTGNYPVGHTVVGGGEVAGSTGTGEIVTMDAARALFRQEVSGTTIGASTALGITLNANESLRFIANMDNTGRMDFVTQDSVTRAIVARLYNGTAQTGTYNLYTLAASENLVGVGDFNADGHMDLLLFNTTTRVLTARLYKLGVFQTLRNFTDTPVSGAPANIAAVPAGLTPVAAGETQAPNSFELIFVTGTGAIEIWDMSRLNRIATGIAGPTIPGSHAFSRMFWR